MPHGQLYGAMCRKWSAGRSDNIPTVKSPSRLLKGSAFPGRSASDRAANMTGMSGTKKHPVPVGDCSTCFSSFHDRGEDTITASLGMSVTQWVNGSVIRYSVVKLSTTTSFAGGISRTASSTALWHSKLNSHSRRHNNQHCLGTRVRFHNTQRLPNYLCNL